MSVCSICQEDKPYEEFYFYDKERTRRRGDCKPCSRRSVKLRKEENAILGDCVDCGGPTSRREVTRCRTCYVTHKASLEPSWSKDKYGYMVASATSSRKATSQHRWLMEQNLGRPLTKHESVHHKNGIRHDNRIENLELWSRWQPAGQRVEDKIKWAEELLALYKPH